jgi:hypothetical protein
MKNKEKSGNFEPKVEKVEVRGRAIHVTLPQPIAQDHLLLHPGFCKI